MKHSKDGKRTKSYDGNGAELLLDDEEALILKQQTMEDEEPLVKREDESMEYASPSPLSAQKPAAAWAVGGLGILLLLVMVLVVHGRPLQAPRVTRLATEATTWVEMLPPDVVSHLDKEVDPCDDLYTFSCGSWQRNVEIPEDTSSVSLSFSTLQDKNEKVVKNGMQHGWPIESELYDSCMNFNNTSSTTADDASLKVLLPVLEQIATTKTKKKLFRLAGVLYQSGTNLVTELSVYADAREATVHVLYAWQNGLSLPDIQYYLDRKMFDSISDAFHAYVVKLFVLVGWEPRAAASQASTVIGFEQMLAPLYEPLDDPVATYNRMSVAQAADKYPLVFSHFLNGVGLLRNLTDQNADVIVRTPEFFRRVEKLVTGDSVTLKTLKAVLIGQKRSPRWKACLDLVTASFPALVGKYFGHLQFDKASEQLASQLVAQVKVSMRKNIKQADWLDGPTRQAAIEKVGKMTHLIGYSTLFEHFPYKLHGDALLTDNMRIIMKHQFNQVIGRIGGPVNRNEWTTSSADVNAMYNPTMNQIILPAGILSRHFSLLNPTLHATLVLLVLSSVTNSRMALIVLEDTTPVTFAVTSNADHNKVLGHVDGTYTLMENIADNGGLKLSFNAYQTYIKKQVRELSKVSETEATKLISPMSQVERSLPADVADKLFFISFAQTFCGKASDIMMKESLITDSHSPPRWRINGAASNSHDFARVFSCPASSPMNPKTKCQLW
ncbi:unnamed protein product [Peronospora farinosa]|uniref:Peptidase M13 N-terminal domain-containing protein n=1 Tax=Peronospora farinosa TaxID=134698 RepID=A0AAV0TLT7_9STRA|nr:unnamed protein product [Peronospora farinosa]